jgi:hypothetical protein
MFSALPPNSDIARRSQHVSNVPTRDSCTAAAGLLFDHFVGAGEQRLGNIMLVELLFRQSNSLRFPGSAGGARLAIEAFNDLLKKHGKKQTVENPLAD